MASSAFSPLCPRRKSTPVSVQAVAYPAGRRHRAIGGRGPCIAAGRPPIRPSPPSTRSTVALAASSGEATGTPFLVEYKQIEVVTQPGVALFDITPHVKELLAEVGAAEGVVHVLSRHTTTAVVINEMEARLVEDVRQFLPKLVPPGKPYLHNDIHLRDGPPDWPGGNAAWRAQEPINAHSHLQAMLLGQSETIPVHKGQLALGTWQSVILVELDGMEERVRTVGLQYIGHGQPPR